MPRLWITLACAVRLLDNFHFQEVSVWVPPTNVSSTLLYPKRPSASELSRLFTPENHEIEWALSITTSIRTRVGILCLLKVFQTLGRFIPPQDIPTPIVSHIFRQLHVESSSNDSLTYAIRTLRRHRDLIRQLLKVNKWDDSAQQLVVKTMTTLASTCSNPADLINGAIDAIFQQRIELPALSTLRRMAGHILQQNSDHLFEKISNQLNPMQVHQLDQLLDVPEGVNESLFTELCRSPGRPTRKNLRTLINRVHRFDGIPDPTPLLANIPEAKITQWADEVNRLNAAELKAYRPSRRHTLILSGLRDSRACSLDDLVAMLTKVMRKIRSRATDAMEIELKKKRTSTEELIELLFNIAKDFELSVDSTTLQTTIDQRFEKYGGVSTVIEQCQSRLNHRTQDWRRFVKPYYHSQRKLLLDLAESIAFAAATGFEPLLDLLSVILQARTARGDWIEIEDDLSFLGSAWHTQLIEPDYSGLYHYQTLEIALFFALTDALSSGNIYIPGSKSYESLNHQLCAVESDPDALAAYLTERQLPADSHTFVRELREWLARSTYWLDQAIYKEEFVALNQQGKPIVPRTLAIPPTESAVQLEQEMLEKLPDRSIVEALYNTDHWTGWTRHFGPPTRIAPQITNPSERYVLTAFAYGCGLGADQAARHFDTPVPSHLLTFANRRHMGTDDLRSACDDLVNFYAQFELPSFWGSGESAAADGSLIETYEDNLFASHHVRYGRTGGIAYRHISDNYIALFSQFIPCGVHEATYILDGLLKNTTVVQPKQIYADTHGQSTTVFALAYLLGIDLFPRIRNWRKLTLFRGENSEGLRSNHLHGGTIDWDLIESHWEDYWHVVLAIRNGTMSSSLILARLNSQSKNNKLYLAFQELGRVIRTVYLQDWIRNDTLRRHVTAGTNKVESFHDFSAHLKFGGEGPVKTNDPAEQEKATVFNQLIANAVMVQTMVDQSDLLRDMDEKGQHINREDIARFSPYVTRHLKRFGEFQTHYEKLQPTPDRNLFRN